MSRSQARLTHLDHRSLGMLWLVGLLALAMALLLCARGTGAGLADSRFESVGGRATSPVRAAVASASDTLLPAPRFDGAVTVEEALHRRRSVRSFENVDPGLAALAQLLWAAQGESGPGGLRTAPSAGALYPLELYVARAEGLFRYVPARHALHLVARRDVRSSLAAAVWGGSTIREAPFVFVIAGVVSRTARKYGARAERYVWLEAGHAAQNLLLQATAMNLGGVTIGAFDDAAIAEVLGVSAHEVAPLYLLSVGVPGR